MADKKPQKPVQPHEVDSDTPVFTPMEEDTGYSVEDAYRVLAGLPLAPVETTPVE